MFVKEDLAGCARRAVRCLRRPGALPWIAIPCRFSTLSLIIVVAAAIVLTSSGTVNGQDITAIGGWSETIDVDELESGAGSDLVGTYESGAAATIMSVTYAGSWRIDVRRTDGTWHTDFSLHTQRTSDGTGSGTISGETAYMEVTTVDTEFCSGTLDRSDIDAGYKLMGMSVNAAPGTYDATVTFTIVSTE
jgi:hypothetical protein